MENNEQTFENVEVTEGKFKPWMKKTLLVVGGVVLGAIVTALISGDSDGEDEDFNPLLEGDIIDLESEEINQSVEEA